MKALRILAVFLVATGLTAFAQKPALVKDTEANGRMPYIHTLETPCNLATPSLCPVLTYTFPAVPAGYRLVVTHVSAQFITDLASQKDMNVFMTNGETASDTDYAAISLQTPVCATYTANAQNICVSSAPLSFYVEQGLTPKIIIHTGRSQSAYIPETERVTIVGYLISL